ncbi:hypothetical protein KEM52_006726, partial [Ascosphaera acerosa]
HPFAKVVRFELHHLRELAAASIAQHGDLAAITASTPTTETGGLDYEVDAVGVLPWRHDQHRLAFAAETLVALGRLRIEQVAGSTPFLHAGGTGRASGTASVAKPLMPSSQCWCVDARATFVLRVGRLAYYRVELPAESPADLRRAAELKQLLARLILFDATPCPFARDFSLPLPAGMTTPKKRRPWRPKSSSQLRPRALSLGGGPWTPDIYGPDSPVFPLRSAGARGATPSSPLPSSASASSSSGRAACSRRLFSDYSLQQRPRTALDSHYDDGRDADPFSSASASASRRSSRGSALASRTPSPVPESEQGEGEQRQRQQSRGSVSARIRRIQSSQGDLCASGRQYSLHPPPPRPRPASRPHTPENAHPPPTRGLRPVPLPLTNPKRPTATTPGDSADVRANSPSGHAHLARSLSAVSLDYEARAQPSAPFSRTTRQASRGLSPRLSPTPSSSSLLSSSSATLSPTLQGYYSPTPEHGPEGRSLRVDTCASASSRTPSLSSTSTISEHIAECIPPTKLQPQVQPPSPSHPPTLPLPSPLPPDQSARDGSEDQHESNTTTATTGKSRVGSLTASIYHNAVRPSLNAVAVLLQIGVRIVTVELDPADLERYSAYMVRPQAGPSGSETEQEDEGAGYLHIPGALR